MLLPGWLFLILPLPLLVRWFLPPHATPQKGLRVPFFQKLVALTGQTPPKGAAVLRPNWIQQLLVPLCWLLIVTAMAQPQLLREPIVQVKSARDLMLLVDLSQSMEAEDFYDEQGNPINRLAAVKLVLTDRLDYGIILSFSRPPSMSRVSILESGKSYTFRNYFEMTYEPDDILAEFGFSLQRSMLTLPQSDAELDRLADLKTSIQRRLPYVSLTSEAARREVLIAPVVLALIDYTQAQLRIEYLINVSEHLKGSLDYYLHTQHSLLIIEAKNADLSRGFTQLAVELIALDQWTDSEDPLLYGAVSTGDVWQFGILHRNQQRVEQDLNLYRVPADLEELFRILVAILGCNVEDHP